MATDRSFVEYIQSQSGLGDQLTYKSMFGEYALYLQSKVVAFACDNQLFVKPTAEGRELLGQVSEHPAYPGSKLYFRIDDAMDDRELLGKLLQVTAQALPLPKPRSKSKPNSKSASASRSKARSAGS